MMNHGTAAKEVRCLHLKVWHLAINC